MSTQLDAIPERPLSATRPMYWSIRRELWENRSLYIAPIVVAGIALFSFFVSSIRLLHKAHTVAGFDATQSSKPYSVVASLIIVSGFVVGFFYCVDALNGERRDRSILFWKSLPVSDWTTVFSKVLVAVALLPLICFTIALATQWVMLMLSTAIFAAGGLNPFNAWVRVPLIRMTFVMFYGITAHALWYAPIYLLLAAAGFRVGTARRDSLGAPSFRCDRRHYGSIRNDVFLFAPEISTGRRAGRSVHDERRQRTHHRIFTARAAAIPFQPRVVERTHCRRNIRRHCSTAAP
jgi:hypothetical protein